MSMRTEYPQFRGDNPFATQAKMLLHMDRLAEWRETGDTFPVQMEINLTNHCNMACRWCVSMYSHTFNPAMSPEERRQAMVDLDRKGVISGHPERARGIDFEHLDRFLFDARALGLKAVVWSGGGEPTTYTRFADAVHAAADYGLEQGLMTNGGFAPELVPVIDENIKWLRVSLDTLDEKKYEYQKHSKLLPRVLENIRALRQKSCKIGVNANVADWNVDDLFDMAEWSIREGIDFFQIRPVLGLPFETRENNLYRDHPTLDWLTKLRPLLTRLEGMSTAETRITASWDKFNDLLRTDRGRNYGGCLAHRFVCVLDATGDVNVCMYHLGDERFTFGNIYEHSIGEIWDSPQRKRVLDFTADGGQFFKSCQDCCRLHEANKLLDFLAYPERMEDVNFP